MTLTAPDHLTGRMTKWTPQHLRDERAQWALEAGQAGHSAASKFHGEFANTKPPLGEVKG